MTKSVDWQTSATQQTEQLRQQHPCLAQWVQARADEPSQRTQIQALHFGQQLVATGKVASLSTYFSTLTALDSLSSQAITQVLKADNTNLAAANFVPAYAGFLALQHFTQQPRNWLVSDSVYLAAVQALQQQAFDAHAVNPFTVLQYAHLPLPGERLVAFFNESQWLEQGTHFAAQWWRKEDTGWPLPVCFAPREQLHVSQLLQANKQFMQRLTQQGFAPFIVDGHDPVAMMLALVQMEQSFICTPLSLPYCIAQISPSISVMDCDDSQLLMPNLLRQPAVRPSPTLAVNCPEPNWQQQPCSIVQAVEQYFIEISEINPGMRVRVGHCGALNAASENELHPSVEYFKTRALLAPQAQPSPLHQHHSGQGAVWHSSEVRPVVNACLANPKGLNLLVLDEPSAVQAMPYLQQRLFQSHKQKTFADGPNELGLPLLSTYLPWEPSLAEGLLLNKAGVARVVFPADANSALAVLAACYGALGAVWNLVVPNTVQPQVFNGRQAAQLIEDGAICVHGHCGSPLQIVAVGALQLQQALLASERLRQHGVAHSLIYMLEPGRFRQSHSQPANLVVRSALFPASVQQRLFVAHCRPEVILGVCRPLDLGVKNCQALGFSQPFYLAQQASGGVNAAASLFEHGCSWAHVLSALAKLADKNEQAWLTEAEFSALQSNENAQNE